MLHKYGNLPSRPDPQPYTDEERQASVAFRDKAGEAIGYFDTSSWLTKFCFRCQGVDLQQAHKALTGLSNQLTRTTHVLKENQVEKALSLPPTNTDEYIAEIDELNRQGKIQ